MNAFFFFVNTLGQNEMTSAFPKMDAYFLLTVLKNTEVGILECSVPAPGMRFWCDACACARCDGAFF